MLNLNEIRAQVKSANLTRATPSPHTPLGINESYRQLKALGWQCHNSEVHPTDRVPVFRLGNAMLRRNRSHASDWIVDVAGGTFEASGDLEELTAKVIELDAETTFPPAPDPAAEIVSELVAQHPNLKGWAERGLALYRDGQIDFPHYHTRIETETATYACDCPARAPRISQNNRLQIATYLNGKACKHSIALYIDTVLKHNQEVIADRKQADRRSRRTFRIAPGDGGLSDQDLEGPLPAETYRRQCQTYINAGDTTNLLATVETMRSHLPALSNGAARQMQAAIDWAVKWGGLESHARDTALPASACDTGSIEDMLGYDDNPQSAIRNPQSTVASQIAAARASLGGALKPEPQNRRGNGRGSFPINQRDFR